jgi:hypothetical protein
MNAAVVTYPVLPTFRTTIKNLPLAVIDELAGLWAL